MALTASTMLPLGTPLPLEGVLAQLQQVHGTPLSLEALAGQPVLVLFLCAHCPFVKHIEPELNHLAADHQDQVALVAIASNSVRTHPQDGPEGLRTQARSQGWSFPYLYDPDQTAARAFRAACTPDFFLFDRQHRLAYRGQLDASRPGNDLPCDGRDLRAAITAVLSDSAVPEPQHPSIGCNIKWHPGQEPPWAR
jgi:thiol-disulfide isomerase/thioredoxin